MLTAPAGYLGGLLRKKKRKQMNYYLIHVSLVEHRNLFNLKSVGEFMVVGRLATPVFSLGS